MLEQVATAQICVAPAALSNPKYILGFGFIVAQCFVWIAASVLTQYMFEETVVESPFIMTYVGVALCMTMFPLRWASAKWKETKEKYGQRSSVEMVTSIPATPIQEADSFDEALDNARAYHSIVEVVTKRSIQNAQTRKPWNHKKHALAALHISPVMFLADYAYNRGLEYTTVASSTVLVSTSCIFVLFLSVLLGQEPLHQGKVWGVILTVAGTAMTTLHDAAEPSTDEATTTTSNFQQQADVNPKLESVLYGDMFSLMAAVGYAAYSVQVRMLCPADDELYSMTLLLGYVGLISAVPLLPMAIYKFLLLESMSWHTFGILVLKGLLDFLVTDYLLFRAVVLTNATVANVGLGLTIPLAFVADWLVRGMAITSLKATGALVVLVGFLLVNLMADSDEVPQVSVTPTSSGGMPDDESNEETP